jgi:Tol biopolymer transport system component
LPKDPDRKLLHYRLVEKIGEGGMGEVWKAVDTRLDREVAVKILPESVAGDEERLARFTREAKAVAALAHPNILAVYDFGHDGDTAYMVTELLEGESLRQRLGEGPVPPRKAADLARQAARGLAAAHEKGFVHRDIKPDNIFVTREGRAKILDFGLAAASVTTESRPERTDTPTETVLTTPGKIVGTADYMSPEQVRGEAVDHRSDIFSFGSVLYEMLTGQRPFHRETVAETMTAVLRDDAPSHSTDGPEVPAALERVVRRCIEKQPEERFQSASDLAFAVENALGTTTSVEAPALKAAAGPAPRRRLGAGVAIVAAVALMAVGVLVGYLTAPAPKPPPTYTQLTFRQGRVSSAQFAADGQTVVYAADWEGEGRRLFTVQEQTPESRPVDVDDAEILSISSRGELALLLRPEFFVGWSRRGTLARISLGAGAPRELLDDVADASWDPAGDELAIARRETGRARLEYPPGKVLYENQGWIEDVRFSPDGKHIAFADHPGPGDNRGYVAVTDLEGNARRLGDVWAGLQGMAWSPDGSEIWFTGSPTGTARGVYAIDLDGSLRPVLRSPVDLLLHDIDASGRALLSRSNLTRGIAGRAPAVTEEVSLSWLDWSYPDALSSDGETILFTEQGEGGGDGYSVIMRSTSGGPAVRLGSGQAMDLSPDGTRVLARLLDEGSPLVVYPIGPGQVERIETPGFRPVLGGWLADGRRLLLVGSLEGAALRGYVFDPDTKEYSAATPENVHYVGWSFSRERGRVVARIVDGPLRIYSIEGDEVEQPESLASVDPEMNPVGWSRDGRSLFMAIDTDPPISIVRFDLETGKTEPMWELMLADSAGLIDIGPIRISPDGDAYVYSYRRDLSTLYVARGF